MSNVTKTNNDSRNTTVLVECERCGNTYAQISGTCRSCPTCGQKNCGE